MRTDKYKITFHPERNEGEVHVGVLGTNKTYIIPEDIIMSENDLDYVLAHRKNCTINNLLSYISEAQGNNLSLMKEDLEYLIKLDDEYIFTSVYTNDYQAFSDGGYFEKILEEFIEEYGTIVEMTSIIQ